MVQSVWKTVWLNKMELISWLQDFSEAFVIPLGTIDLGSLMGLGCRLQNFPSLLGLRSLMKQDSEPYIFEISRMKEDYCCIVISAVHIKPFYCLSISLSLASIIMNNVEL
jgi:hypothetical protein